MSGNLEDQKNDNRDKFPGFPIHHHAPSGVTKKPKDPHHARRAFFHDYCSPGYYLITATMRPEAARKTALSSIPLNSHIPSKGNPMIIPLNSPLGECIRTEIKTISKYHPQFRIIRYVIMPDHIHFILQVKERLKRKLGYELAGFFGACSHHFFRLIERKTEFQTLFYPFDDEIIFNLQQLDRAIKYVENNPLKYIIKKKHPDIFKRYLHLQLGDREYAAYGNIFLLRKIYLLPVRIHRRWSAQEFNEYVSFCCNEIRKGAIPISPAIHPVEKDILNKAIELGSSIIKITDQGMPERFKPQGKDFDLCAKGKLLLLAPWPTNPTRHLKSGFTEFHDMNEMALNISLINPNSRFVIRNSCQCHSL